MRALSSCACLAPEARIPSSFPPYARSTAGGFGPGPRVGPAVVVQYDVAGLLADHVKWRHDEEAGYVGKDRRIHHAQVLHAADAEIAVEDRLGVAVLADLARPAGMV